ncbi:hypothetical protein ACFL4T_14310, partial [candidate division KSB1 bacterium]
YIMGMKSMWVHWMWGFTMGAFCLAYMGKWVRRSNVMTGAEWMITRFGEGAGGKVARTASAVMAVFLHSSLIGYAFQGIGKFAAVYLPFSPTLCAALIIGLTTFYVLLGGLYTVVVTDVIQTVILTIASVIIAAVAYFHLNPDTLNSILPQGWNSVIPVWRFDTLAGTSNAEFELFGAFVLVWVLKGVLLSTGGPAQLYDFQRYLAARTPKDAAKIGAAWSLFLIVRWGMAMGIVLLALAGINSVSDPEQVMPLVIQKYLPAGIRGFVIAGLLAAFMSTFSSTVNSGASYIIRDFWQPFFKPDASEKSLVRSGYAATLGIVIIGMIVGLQTKSINQIWSWVNLALGAGVVVPNVLRWYWWRMNGWGYAAGTLSGILCSLIVLFMPEIPLYISFPSIVIVSLITSVIVSLKTPAVEEETLLSFYKTIRPFGFWKQVSRAAPADSLPQLNRTENPTRVVLNTVLGIIAIIGLYISPMYLVGHWHKTALLWFTTSLIAVVILYWTWYKPLSEEE